MFCVERLHGWLVGARQAAAGSRRFEEAMEAVDDEIQSKKLPLEQAVGDMKRSSAVLEAALETLEDKLKEPQHDFIQRFVPMIEARRPLAASSAHTRKPTCRLEPKQSSSITLDTKQPWFAGDRVARDARADNARRVRRARGRRPRTCLRG